MVEYHAGERDAGPRYRYTMGNDAQWNPFDKERLLKSAADFGRGVAGSVSTGSKKALGLGDNWLQTGHGINGERAAFTSLRWR